VPVFWPVLVMYWLMLFILTSRLPTLSMCFLQAVNANVLSQ
jgi:hypothetical protein